MTIKNHTERLEDIESLVETLCSRVLRLEGGKEDESEAIDEKNQLIMVLRGRINGMRESLVAMSDWITQFGHAPPHGYSQIEIMSSLANGLQEVIKEILKTDDKLAKFKEQPDGGDKEDASRTEGGRPADV